MSEVKKIATRESYGNALAELGAEFENLVVLDADLAAATKTGVFKKAFPDRHIDCGIAECNMIGIAAGLAATGKIPFASSFAMFAAGRAFEQVRNSVAYPKLNVKIGATHAGISVGEDGATHHGLYDLAYLSEIPGMIVSAPADAGTLRDLMYTAQLPQQKGPMAIRYPRGHCDTSDWRTPMKALEIGKGRKLKDGHQVTVLSLGTICTEVKKAIKRAENEGYSVAHYDMVFLKPIDHDILEGVAKSDTPIITVEDASVKGGLGSAVTEWLAERGIKRDVHRIGVPDKFVPHGSIAELMHLCGMDSEAIYAAIVNSINPNSL